MDSSPHTSQDVAQLLKGSSVIYAHADVSRGTTGLEHGFVKFPEPWSIFALLVFPSHGSDEF